MKPELKKGDFNGVFGMSIERPFYIVSALPDERYLDRIGYNMVIKTENGFNTQQWYFDQKSRTIKSVKDNRSWDIQGNGSQNNMRAYNTNSGWWQLFKWNGKDNFCNVKDNRCLDA
jgi:hypothetical protein